MTLLVWPVIDTFAGAGIVEIPIPDGALVHMNFLTGNYFVDDVPTPVGDLLGSSGTYDSVFNPAEIVPGEGMGFSSTNLPAAIGPLLAALVDGLTDGMTIVVEASSLMLTKKPALYFWEEATGDDATGGLTGHNEGATRATANLNADWDSLTLAMQLIGPPDFGSIHRAAYTFARDLGGGSWQNAVGVDGLDPTIVTRSSHFGGIVPGGDVWIGSWGDIGSEMTGARMRALTIYPALDPADLPALTAP